MHFSSLQIMALDGCIDAHLKRYSMVLVRNDITYLNISLGNQC